MALKLKLGVDEKPENLGLWVLYSVQHILASFSGIVAVPLVFGSVLGFSPLEMGTLVGDMLIVCGIVTLIQTVGIGFLGGRMPQIMGSSFTFIGPGLAIGFAVKGLGGTVQEAYGAILGASLFGSFVQAILGGFVGQIRKVFPPVVQGVVVSLIGLTILGVGVDWFAGGYGAKDYGSISNLTLGFIVMVITILFSYFGKGIISTGAIFFGMLIGYLIAIPMGKVDFSVISQAGMFHLPKPFMYGMTFKLQYIIPMAIASLVTMVEATGDTVACAKVAEVDITDGKRIKGAIVWGGIGSVLGSMINGTPLSTFSQNTGVVSLTGIASRFVVMGSAIMLIIMGLFPKIGALVATMPQPVLGGAGVVLFATIAAVGIGIFRDVEDNNANLLIIGLSICAGLSVVIRPTVLDQLPSFFKTVLSSGITTGTLTAIILNLIFNKIKK